MLKKLIIIWYEMIISQSTEEENMCIFTEKPGKEFVMIAFDTRCLPFQK